MVLSNKIMNDFYEHWFSGIKPSSSTDTETLKRFIHDKYLKLKWVDESAEDPVKMFAEGRWGKKKSKKSKAAKEEEKSESEEKEEKPKKKKKTRKQPKKESEALIDFESRPDDDFADFVDAKPSDDFTDFTEAPQAANAFLSPGPSYSATQPSYFHTQPQL